ncbi:hypothetical protein GS473_18370 [Rhodococcus hoagii]|nr:hypothetical protein [Prescottella equi]
MWLLGRPKLEGAENIPTDGPAILASNHQAVLDSFFLPLRCPRRITFLAKSEYFTGPGSRVPSRSGSSRPWVRCRSTAATGADAARTRSTPGWGLGQGKLLGIYPEGTRSPDGRLLQGKTGMARLALESGVKVIPSR